MTREEKKLLIEKALRSEGGREDLIKFIGEHVPEEAIVTTLHKLDGIIAGIRGADGDEA